MRDGTAGWATIRPGRPSVFFRPPPIAARRAARSERRLPGTPHAPHLPGPTRGPC